MFGQLMQLMQTLTEALADVGSLRAACSKRDRS